MSHRGALRGSANPDRIEAPVTLKSYLMCAFSAFGGIFFGYDSGYINGVMGMPYFIRQIEGPDATSLSGFSKAIITSVLSLGTFVGALVASDFADLCGRRATVLGSCAVFLIGVVLQVASAGLPLLVIGRAIAGLGVGGVSAILILYMSEIAPRKVRGAIVSGYQFCITIGLLLASAIDYATQNRADTSSYRIPIAIQMVWALVLAGGLSFLPESPRFYVRKGDLDRAADSLSRLRGQPVTSEFVKTELSEIIANYEHENSLVPPGGYWSTWLACGRGSLRKGSSHLRRTVLGTSLQMMQQWTGVNFVFYFGTTLDLGTIQDPFQISLITTLVNVFSTPISFWAIEKLGRRPLFLWGALGMTICQFIVAIIGTIAHSTAALSVMITFICVFIVFFAITWGPGAWVLVGEIFPLPIRARGVALSTASNWLWNFIIGLITPYMVDKDKGNLGAKVFYIWGSLCATAFFFTWFLIPETKGLTLEQVNRMLEETTPRTSAKWKPHDTYTAETSGKDTPAPNAFNRSVDDDADERFCAGSKMIP
ncbi:general substrate transporter [Xylaria bambusicola]|uniref:general substrate transporter n=1 Tax=Xylaria bambusicola TaxID=326684 RepID=UPI002007BE8D|nr:general substrate transporter [Xylaria bambusicola]KAI0525641.1 general substrate transporter [Xylaria bambusicola]